MCLACSQDCTPAKTMVNVDGANNVCAAADTTKKGTLDLAGSGTPAFCGTSTGVHTPNLKNAVGSFTFTPSFPSSEMYVGTTGYVDFGAGA